MDMVQDRFKHNNHTYNSGNRKKESTGEKVDCYTLKIAISSKNTTRARRPETTETQETTLRRNSARYLLPGDGGSRRSLVAAAETEAGRCILFHGCRIAAPGHSARLQESVSEGSPRLGEPEPVCIPVY